MDGAFYSMKMKVNPGKAVVNCYNNSGEGYHLIMKLYTSLYPIMFFHRSFVLSHDKHSSFINTI